MANVLITGGRAPAALELARAFHEAGHRVIAAESLRPYLTAYSRVVAKSYKVPSPRRETEGFLSALARIIEAESIDLLVPTCEELYYVARGHGRLPSSCRIFTDSLETLRELHDKFAFIERSRSLGLAVPETRLLTSRADLEAAFAAAGLWVFKPVYSRFSTQAILRPERLEQLADVHPTPEVPWVAQRFVDGRQVCSYSIAHEGVLRAHAAYPTEFTAGQGATIAFRAIAHDGVRAWVSRFVAETSFTGQIAFDFIEARDGTVHAIECNPRATSGVHLLTDGARLADALLEPSGGVYEAPGEARTMTGMAMVVYGLPKATSWSALSRWLRVFRESRDVIYRAGDVIPSLLQLVPYVGLVLRGLVSGRSALEMSTADIEWNGEP